MRPLWSSYPSYPSYIIFTFFNVIPSLAQLVRCYNVNFVEGGSNPDPAGNTNYKYYNFVVAKPLVYTIREIGTNLYDTT